MWLWPDPSTTNEYDKQNRLTFGYIVIGISADCFFHVLSHAINRFFSAAVKYAGSGQSIPARTCHFEETTKGTITPGKLADLVVLDPDPTRLAADEFGNLQFDKTIIGGKVVWEKTRR